MIDAKKIVKMVQAEAATLQIHKKTIDIYENNLLDYVLKSLANQLSPKSYAMAIHRLVPINIFPRVVDKISNIYQQGVIRDIKDGDDSDEATLSWLVGTMRINDTMHNGNTLFNACKSTLLHPYVDKKTALPALRVIQNDRFIVLSEDPINPMRPTTVILLAGKRGDLDIYWVYTDTDFAVVLSDGTIDRAEMARLENPEGINPIGRLPFVYVNSSALRLCPYPDIDAIRMTEVIPVMLTDLNLAAMFQSFSILYGIDLSIEDMTYAPGAFWFLKSDSTGSELGKETKPEIGTLKPEVDFQEVLNLIQSQLSMWLGTKGIRANGVGELTQQNFASGISKIIDEMDTLDIRQSQCATFSDAESELWDLILKDMLPYWISTQQIDFRGSFTPTASVITSFKLDIPGSTRAALIDEQIKEVNAKFTTRKRAIQSLNPVMTSEEVDDLMHEIDEESQPMVSADPTNVNEVNSDGSQTAKNQDRYI